MMFQTLLNAVRNEDLTQIEQFIHEQKEIEELTTVEAGELFKEALVKSNTKVIHALINGKLLENDSFPLENLEPLNGRTIFGFAVFEKFDEGTLTLLASEGYDRLSYDECVDFVSNLVASYTLGDLTKFTSYLKRLKVILSVCQKTAVQKTIRNLLYNEPRIIEVLETVQWLKNHFKYGYGICSFKKVKKIHMEMAEGKWSDAVDTILSSDGEDIDEIVYEIFPSGENIPAWTLLSYAVSKSKTDIVNLLISKGADVNKHSERIYEGRLVKFTPFELAVEMNFLECCKILTENGANIYLQSSNPIGNILENAIKHENIDLVKLILKHRRYSDDDIHKCLDEIVCNINDANIRTQMTECLKIYTIFSHTEPTRTMKAMLLLQNGTEEEVLSFIESFSLADLNEEIYPDTVWKLGFTNLLTCATKLNKQRIVETLLERGCDVEQPEANRHSAGSKHKCALVLAIEENNHDMCRLLLKWGARVVGDNMYGQSIFTYAFRRRNPKILKLILERLYYPCTVFLEYANFLDFSVSGEDIMNTFSVDLLSFILHRSQVSVDMWLDLIRVCSIRTVIDSGEKRGRHFLLNLLLNYLPSAPLEMQAALDLLRKSPSETEIIRKEADWLLKNAVKCPSLQSLCRFAIRQAVQPCTEGNIQSLQLPVQIQEYLLEHPLAKCLSPFSER